MSETQDSLAKEGHAMRRTIDRLLTALVLIRLGQELGTASPATQAVHDVLELLVSLATSLTR